MRCAGRRARRAGRHGSGAGWKSEKFAGKVAKSEKLGPKVRFLRGRADLVRNSSFKMYLSEKFMR